MLQTLLDLEDYFVRGRETMLDLEDYFPKVLTKIIEQATTITPQVLIGNVDEPYFLNADGTVVYFGSRILTQVTKIVKYEQFICFLTTQAELTTAPSSLKNDKLEQLQDVIDMVNFVILFHDGSLMRIVGSEVKPFESFKNVVLRKQVCL